jgi:hypothetical protein
MMKIKESIDEGRTVDNGQPTTDKKRTGAAISKITAPDLIRGYCPHPSNH